MMGRLIDTDALTTALIDAYGLDPERLRDVVERIPAAECEDTISRAAAIDFEKLINASDLIEWIMESYPDWCIGDIRSIVDHIYNMPTQTNASNALEALDCISRAAAIEVADAIWSVTGDKNVAKVWDQLKDLPPAQPEVIRCKDCKFYSPMNRETKTGICNLTIHQNFGDDWFCAGAERRTGCDRLMPTI